MVCMTLPWTELDSNHRSRETCPSFDAGSCHLLDSLHAEKSARTRTDITRMPAASRGTDGSNPALSRKESANHRFLSGEAASGVCLNRSGRFTKSKVLYRREKCGSSGPGTTKS